MNSKIKKRILRIGLLALALIAITAGIAFPVYAETTSAANTTGFHIVQGKVNSRDAVEKNFVVATPNKGLVTIETDDATQYYLIPLGKAQGHVNNQIGPGNWEDRREGLPNLNRAAPPKDLRIPPDWRSNMGWLAIFNNQASFTDIAEGDRVIVRAASEDLAKQVLIIKAPVNRTIKGTITSDGDEITIDPEEGETVTLKVVENTRITLKGLTSIDGYAVALYNSANNNALVVNVQAAKPAAAVKPNQAAESEIESIAITPDSPADLEVGATQHFMAVATYANSKTANVTSRVTWKSSNPKVATISPAGLAKGLAAGSAGITASVPGVTSPEVTLNVVAP